MATSSNPSLSYNEARSLVAQAGEMYYIGYDSPDSVDEAIADLVAEGYTWVQRAVDALPNAAVHDAFLRGCARGAR